MAGKSPDYILALLHQPSQRKNTNVGAAWIQPDGRISIRLSPGVVLNGNDGDMLVSLFPYTPFADRKPAPAPVDYFMEGQPTAAVNKSKGDKAPTKKKFTGSIHDMEDDIPF